MTGRRTALAVLAASLLTVLGPLNAGADEPPALVEAETCWAPSGDVPDEAVGPGQTQISFEVPATTWLALGDGVVVAVATNTGCAPRPTDRFVVDGRFATAPEVAAALHAGSTGDWRRPGDWHAVS